MPTNEQNLDKKSVSLNDIMREKLNQKRDERKKGKQAKNKFGQQSPVGDGYTHNHSGRFNKYVVE